MTYNNLLLNEDGGVLTITINRPEVLNALNHQTMTELGHFFGEGITSFPHLHGIIITGAGDRAFVAGADIKAFLTLDGNQGEELARFGQQVFFLIERCTLPVIAIVNGFALGGGCELAMASHIRIASEKARFGQPEVNLGNIPGYGGTQRLIQCIGKTKAIELLMTGDMIDAQEALRLGLVNYVCEPGQEMAKALELLSKIKTKGPLAISHIIKAVNHYFQHDVDGFDEEVKAFGLLAQSQDFVEGATAFLEKRPAAFKGQ